MLFNTHKYRIVFFKVGEGSKGGDAILIELFYNDNNPYLILIDGGYKATGESICKFVKKEYTSPRFRCLINTHPDIDHLSGFKSLLEDDLIQIDRIYMNRPWKDSGFKASFFNDNRITPNSLLARLKNAFATADDIEMLAGKRNIPISNLFAGDKLLPGVLTILGPSKKFYQKHLLTSDKTPASIYNEMNSAHYTPTIMSEENYVPCMGNFIEWFDEEQTSAVNQTSVVLLLEIGDSKFLFTGDAGKDALNEALNEYESMGDNNDCHDITHFQLPHHGSRKNIDPAILERISPSICIISCPPNGDSEGHPSRRLINKILEMNKNTKIYVTKQCNFIFHKGMSVKYKHQTPQSYYNKMDGKAKKM